MKGDRPRECVSGRWPDGPALPEHPEVKLVREVVLQLERRLEGSDMQKLSSRTGIGRQTLEMVLAGEVWPDSRFLGRLRAHFGDTFIQVGRESNGTAPVEPEPQVSPPAGPGPEEIAAALGGAAKLRQQIAELQQAADTLNRALRLIES